MSALAFDSEPLETVGWVGEAVDGFVRLIDQTRLPTEFIRIDLRDVPAVWEAIKSLRVRARPRSESPPPSERSSGREHRASTIPKPFEPAFEKRPDRSEPAGRPPSISSGHSTAWIASRSTIPDSKAPAFSPAC